VGALTAIVKKGVGLLSLQPPFSSWLRRRLRGGINVVYTHYVGESVPYYADFYLGSTIDRFDRDLVFLKRHFDFVSLANLVGQEGPRNEPSRPLLALTFDDGFDALGNGVLEVLSHHEVQATSFVITDMVGNKNLMWRNKLTAIRALREERLYVRHYNDLVAKFGQPGISRGDELLPASTHWTMKWKDEMVDALWSACDMPALDEFLDEHRPYFTWGGLEQWLSAGHHVGLHTATHPFCSRLSPEEIRAEIEEPASLLRSRLGLRFLPFSYPFGIRLSAPVDQQLYESRVFDCAFGIEGFVPRGTPGYRLERASIEGDFAYSVFGSAFVGSAMRFTPSRLASSH